VEPRRRALPFVLVGALGMLSAGAIVLSVATAPVTDVEQLHLAAGSTLAASGFSLVDTNSVVSEATVGPTAGSGTTQVVHVRYQAPDAVEETGPNATGQIVTVVVVGSRRFEGVGSRWEELPPAPGLGAAAVDDLLFPLRAAATADQVVRSGDRYGFVPKDLTGFLTTLLGLRPAHLESLQVSAKVTGDFVSTERISVRLGQERLQVALVFNAIGSAPPVTVPPAAEVVPATP
jgi:hypothetical protein